MIRILPYVLVAMFFMAYVVCIFILLSEIPMLSKKDCMIAEISPDFTVKEKEFCRELRRKK